MMDALDAILSKPPQNRDAIENMLLQHDYPDEARKAAEKYAQLQAIATAVREVVDGQPLGDTAPDNFIANFRIRLGALRKLAAALAAMEQETK